MSNGFYDFEKAYLQSLKVIASHRQTIRILLSQVKAHGGFEHTPIAIINGLISARNEINRYRWHYGVDVIPFEDDDVFEDYFIEHKLI